MTATILITVACFSARPADDRAAPQPEVVRAAVAKALPLILKGTGEYPGRRDCFSCHHQAVPVLALASARELGFAIPAEAIAGPVDLTEADLRGSIASYRKGDGQGGGVTRAGYALLTLEVGGRKPDEVTDAVAGYLLEEGRGPRPLAGFVQPPTVGGERVHLHLPRPPGPGGIRRGGAEGADRREGGEVAEVAGGGPAEGHGGPGLPATRVAGGGFPRGGDPQGV